MIRMENTFEKVVEVVSEVSQIEVGKINENTNLYEDLAIDSLVALEIISRIEEEWNFSLTDYPELLDEMETVGALVAFLDKMGNRERHEKRGYGKICI